MGGLPELLDNLREPATIPLTTITRKIFETKSNFDVKYHTTGKLQFLFFSSFLLLMIFFGGGGGGGGKLVRLGIVL